MSNFKASEVVDLPLGMSGKERIEWAGRNMPVLASINERFKIEKPFAGLKVAGCMHVTAETANLMIAIKNGGAEVALCASNPLSTQDDTAVSLVKDYGISVFAINGVKLEQFFSHINQALDIKPDLVFDDGCDLVNMLHTNRVELLDSIIGGCEETTTGVLRLRQMSKEGKLKLPMIAVNDSDTKHMFDNRYGTGQSTMDAIFRATNNLVAGSNFVVAGFGYCGKGVAERARGMGANVIITEIDPLKALDALMQGYQVMEMSKAASIGDFFVTVTGCKDVLVSEHFALMKDSAIVANAGHFDVEIDVAWLEANKVSKNRVRFQTDEYRLKDGKRILLIAEGRLVNLTAAEGHPASVMDMSFANQALSAEWLVKNKSNLTPGVIEVPKHIDGTVATLKLESMNITIDKLSSEQELYLNSWEHGS